MINSVHVGWALTLIFGTAVLLFAVGRGAGPTTTSSDRPSGGIHVAAGAAMITMAWSWGSKLPVWAQVVAFALAAGWFVARVVRGRLHRTQPGGPCWHDLHHAAMAGTLAWSMAAMSGLRSIGSFGDPHARDDMMPMPHHHEMPSALPASTATRATRPWSPLPYSRRTSPSGRGCGCPRPSEPLGDPVACRRPKAADVLSRPQVTR